MSHQKIILLFVLVTFFSIQLIFSDTINRTTDHLNSDKLKELFLQELEFEANVQEKENYSDYMDNALQVYDEYEEKRDIVKQEINKQKYIEEKQKRNERKKIREKYRSEIKSVKKESKELKRNLKDEYNKKYLVIDEKYDQERKKISKSGKNYSN